MIQYKSCKMEFGEKRVSVFSKVVGGKVGRMQMQVVLPIWQSRNLRGSLFDGLCSLQEMAAHLLRVKTLRVIEGVDKG